MRVVKERALIERAKRHFLKDGSILHKHRDGTRDYLMNGRLHVYLVDENTNLVTDYWNRPDFTTICRDEDILKKDEIADYEKAE